MLGENHRIARFRVENSVIETFILLTNILINSLLYYMNSLVSKLVLITTFIVSIALSLVQKVAGREAWAAICREFFQKNNKESYRIAIWQKNDRHDRGIHPMNKPHPS